MEGGLRTKGKYKKSTPDKPLISVITVIYNNKNLLEKTVLSVINQAYENIEYIIIDGGSTDGTLNIIKKYENKIDYWISEPDKGIYDAMNKGIDSASGEWIIFMNAGDRFYAIDTISQVFKNYPQDSDLIYGHSEVVYENGFSRIQKAGIMKDLWKGMIFTHQSLFVKLSLMKECKFNIGNRIAADFEFIYSSFAKNYKFAKSDVIVSSIMAGGISDTDRVAAIKGHWRVVKRFSNSFTINIYYIFSIIDAFLRLFAKKILPKKIVNFLITKKR